MNMQALKINFHMNDIYAVKTFFFVGIVVSKYNATLVLSSP